MARAARNVSASVIAAIVGAAVFWSTWVAGFVFVWPLVGAMADLRDRTVASLVNFTAVSIAALASAVVLRIGLSPRVRMIASLILAVGAWGFATVVTTAFIPRMHVVPPMSLAVQLPVVAVAFVAIAMLRSSRSRAT